jgi:hypothetical protein
MWRLDLDSLMRATEDGSYPVHWEQVTQKAANKGPGKISHHKCAVVGDRMVLVGGMKNGDLSNNEVYVFDLKTNTWEVAKSSGEIPSSGIDDHTLVQMDKQLVIFGGFTGGSRINSTYSAQINPNNTVVWSCLRKDEAPSKTFPVQRNSHSAVAGGPGSMFVFGG